MNDRWRQLALAVVATPLVVLTAACATTGANRASGPEPGAAPVPVTLDRPPVLTIEAVVTDKKGLPAQDLRVTDFEVVVDGRRRPGMALGRLFRGPGAEFAAASRGPGGPGEVLPLSEPSRVVVIAVDEASLSPGDDLTARLVAQSCVGMLGLSDRVSVVTLPAREGTTTITFERVDVGKKLAGLRPRWGRGPQRADEEATPAPPAGGALDARAA